MDVNDYNNYTDMDWKFGYQVDDPSISDLIAFDNVSYPQWTYDQLAIPTFHIDEDKIMDFLNTTSALSITARLPAARVQSSCKPEFFAESEETWLSFDGKLQFQTPCPNKVGSWILFEQLDVDGFTATTGYEAEWDCSYNQLLPKDLIPDGANYSLIDPFFQALVWGRDGVPLEELVDKANVNTTLIPAIERLMARRWAQYINSLYRSTNTSGLTNSTDDDGNLVDLHDFLSNLTATVIDDKNRLRLVQSAISTHLLGGLLLFMVSCALISFICTRRQSGGRSRSKILFQDPGSIAAKMSLFVGSRFVERLRNEVVRDGSQAGDGAAGAEGRSWREMEARAESIFEETTFSLGWWADGEGGEAGRRFGIDIGEADDRWDGGGA
ncbi:hypothetical protein SLS58_011248 [Diplodia intermedia]|uniref:Uncharacterized protein n=1 Tax=Diplodia intermedia TaxID=856260 RepID=A0ABR3T1R1_9PEZI